MMSVAAKTIQPPQARLGIKSKMSTRNARRVTSRVGNVRMRRARRYRGECEGPRRCDAAAKTVQSKVNTAATGCTIRIDESLFRLSCGSVKLSPLTMAGGYAYQYSRYIM